jgi:hypothetical protein
MIRCSVTILRGCFGGCAFCALSLHAGTIVQSRSEASIVREVEAIRDRVPGFSGTISDLGGPTANMYGLGCGRPAGVCRRASCLYPGLCRFLETSPRAQLEMLDDALELYAQLRVGSFTQLERILSQRLEHGYPKWDERSDEQKEELDAKEKGLTERLRVLHAFVFPELKEDASHQVRDPDIEEDARIAWDLHQVIREHHYYRTPPLRSSKTCNLPHVVDEKMHWTELLRALRGDLEAVECDTLVGYDVAPDDVRKAAKEAAEVISGCLPPD